MADTFWAFKEVTVAKQRHKRVDSGRLIQEILYTGITPKDPPKVRKEKTKHSSAARRKLNDKSSWKVLKRILARNFKWTDLVVTLTVADEFLPNTRAELRALLKKFLADLRLARRRRGRDLLYIYALEGFYPGGRPHIHIVINGTGADYGEIRRLWAFGDNTKFETVNVYGYEELAKYMSKEAREHGRPKPGERSWVCSRNIERPIVGPTTWVPDTFELEIPRGATNVRWEVVENEWGRYVYLEYLLPRRKLRRRKLPRKGPKPKQSIDHGIFSNLEQCIIIENG